jgi:adenylylsulfate kinase
LYEKARAGLVKDFTGVSAPYETPLNPDLVLDTENLSKEESVKILLGIALQS